MIAYKLFVIIGPNLIPFILYTNKEVNNLKSALAFISLTFTDGKLIEKINIAIKIINFMIQNMRKLGISYG